MRIHYVFPNRRKGDWALMLNKEVPRNRFYGLTTIREMGHEIKFTDTRFSEFIYRRIGRRLRRWGINFFSFKGLIELKGCDFIVVKDTISLPLTLFCRSISTRVMFVDCFSQYYFWKVPFIRLAVNHASKLIVFSSYQAELWRDRLRVTEKSIQPVPFGIDTEFFDPELSSHDPKKQYILCVGADDRRDLKTLDSAIGVANQRIVVVSNRSAILTYQWKNKHLVDILYNVSYNDLRELYKNALYVIIPILPDTDYPSGLTALLEAMSMGKHVVCSKTPHLEEYARSLDSVYFCPPGDANKLSGTIESLNERISDLNKYVSYARKHVITNYSVEIMGEAIARAILIS